MVSSIQIKFFVCLLGGVKRHFQQYFSFIGTVRFIGGGNVVLHTLRSAVFLKEQCIKAFEASTHKG
jgi:hypothetical protein